MGFTFTLFGLVFNIVDILAFVLMIIGGITAAVVGFAQTFSRRGGYVIGFFTALFLNRWANPILRDTLGLGTFLSSLIAFVILFVIGYALVRIVGSMLETALEAVGLGGVNSFFGFIWGVGEMIIVLAFILFFLNSINVGEIQPYLDSSQFVQLFVQRFMPETVRKISETIR